MRNPFRFEEGGAHRVGDNRHDDEVAFKYEADQPPGATREFWFGLAHALALTAIIAAIGVALWVWLA